MMRSGRVRAREFARRNDEQNENHHQKYVGDIIAKHLTFVAPVGRDVENQAK